MSDTNYKALLNEALVKLEKAVTQRNNLEIEIAKLRQFIAATTNMLPDQERVEFECEMLNRFGESVQQTAGLAASIRKVLREAPYRWFTAAQVRYQLVKFGFDFSGYTSNPLASVSTTLKRFKAGEVETATIEGATAYRWRGQLKKRRTKISLDKAAQNMLGALKRETAKSAMNE